MAVFDFRMLPVSLRARWALEAVFSHLGRGEKIPDIRDFTAVLLEALKRFQVPTEDTRKVIHIAKELGNSDLALLIAWSRFFCMGAEFGPEPQIWLAQQGALRPKAGLPLWELKDEKDKRVRVTFTSSTVIVNGKEKVYDDAWRMLEYFLNKKKRVHFREGYLIYPGWGKRGVTDGRTRFRVKKDKAAQELRENFGIQTEFKGYRRRNADYWELISHNVSSNIPEAEDHYRKAEELFGNDHWPRAKAELVEALRVYGNHLQSHLLLIKCYEKQGFKNVPEDEVGGVLLPSWDYLRDKCIAVENITNLCAKKKKDKDLQVFLPLVQNDPIYSQLRGHTTILGKWLIERKIIPDYTILAELRKLLKAIVTTKDKSVKEEKATAFCQTLCVREVLTSKSEWLRAGAALLYPEIEDCLQTTRLEAMARRTFRSVKEFQKCLRNNLISLTKAKNAKERLPISGDSEKTIRQIRQINRVEEKLRQQRSGPIGDEDLIEAVSEECSWDKEYIGFLLRIRKGRLPPPEDLSILEVEDQDMDIEGEHRDTDDNRWSVGLAGTSE